MFNTCVLDFIFEIKCFTHISIYFLIYLFIFVALLFCCFIAFAASVALFVSTLRGRGALRADSVPRVVFLRGLQGPRHQRQALPRGLSTQHATHSPTDHCVAS